MAIAMCREHRINIEQERRVEQTQHLDVVFLELFGEFVEVVYRTPPTRGFSSKHHSRFLIFLLKSLHLHQMTHKSVHIRPSPELHPPLRLRFVFPAYIAQEAVGAAVGQKGFVGVPKR